MDNRTTLSLLDILPNNRAQHREVSAESQSSLGAKSPHCSSFFCMTLRHIYVLVYPTQCASYCSAQQTSLYRISYMRGFRLRLVLCGNVHRMLATRRGLVLRLGVLDGCHRETALLRFVLPVVLALRSCEGRSLSYVRCFNSQSLKFSEG